MRNPLINPLFKGILAWAGLFPQAGTKCPAVVQGISTCVPCSWDRVAQPRPLPALGFLLSSCFLAAQPQAPDPPPRALSPAASPSPSPVPVPVPCACGQWEGRGGLPWPRSPSRGRGAALPPGWAPLQPKQGRSSNPLRVGSGGRSRVSLSQLRELIIPRELVGASSPLLPPSTSTHRAPAARAVPPGPVPSPAPPTPGSALGSRWGEEEVAGRLGPGQRFKTIKRRTGGCSIARCWRLISLLLQIIRSCDCLIDHMIV